MSLDYIPWSPSDHRLNHEQAIAPIVGNLCSSCAFVANGICNNPHSRQVGRNVTGNSPACELRDPIFSDGE